MSEEYPAKPLEFLRKTTEFYTQKACGEVDYRRLADDFRFLGGAAYAAINEVSDDREYTVTRAISGTPDHVERAAKMLGFNLIGASYKIDDPVTTLLERDGLCDLGTLCDVAGLQLPKVLCSSIARMFDIRRVYGLALRTGSGPLATVMLLFRGGEEPRNEEHLRLLGNVVSVCLERKIAQEDYLSRVFELEREQGRGADKALLALRRAAETVPDILYQLDTEGNIEFINQAITRYGYTRDELIGRSILEIVHPDDRESASHRLRERRTGARRTLNFEVRLLTGSNKTSYFTFHTRALSDAPILSINAEGLYRGEVEGRNYIGTIGVGHDITEKKIMKSEIAERERIFRHIAESVGEAIWLETNDPFKLIYVNRACRRLFELSDEDLEDPYGWLTRVHPEDREKLRLYSNVPKEENGYREYRLITRGGEERWVRTRVMPIEDSSASSTRFVGIAVDITSEKREQEELEKRVAAGEAFVRELNHRVKNNLLMLDSMLNLQLPRLEEGSGEAVLLMELKSRLRAVGLVHEMLYKAYDQRRVDISSYLQSLGDNILSSSLPRSGRVDAVYRVPAISMEMDTVIPLGMIFSELMTNVLKYAFPDERSGQVRIELTPMEDSIYNLTVADDGVGLPDDYEHRKEDSIGHLLVSSLAKQIDGEFSVERAEGETRFSVRFAAGEEFRDGEE